MRTQQVKWILVCCLCVVAMTRANENPNTGLGGEAVNPNSKVKVIDQSRVLTPEEVDKLGVSRDQIPVVVPLLKKPPRIVNPKGFNPQLAVDPVPVPPPAEPAKTEGDNNQEVKLPPMPLIMPSFLHGLIDEPAVDPPLPVESSDSDKPKGIVSVLLLKSHRTDDPAETDSQAGSGDNTVKSSRFIIFRILPRPIGNLFGLDDDESENSDSSSANKLLGGGDDDVDKKREQPPHLLGGGDDDVDKKRVVHLLGGEGDPDRVRLDRLEIDDTNKGVFTGGNEDVFNNNMNQHKIFVFSMFDRLRSVFDRMRDSIEQQVRGVSVNGGDDDSSQQQQQPQPLPFISIRTDDGQSALIPNDIGYAEKHHHEQSLNKCMMLQFMRLKASMYYRTMLHLLFFTGVLLFIFSLLFLTVRTCRRRGSVRHHRLNRHNMSVSSIEAAAGAKSKLAAYKAWQGMDQSSLIVEPSDKVVLIQAPPAYDQVFIHDKNSTLASSAAPRQVQQQSAFMDECETKSLPPEYQEKPATAI